MNIILNEDKEKYSIYEIMQITGLTRLSFLETYFRKPSEMINEEDIDFHAKTIYKENFDVLTARYEESEDFFDFEKRMHSNIHLLLRKNENEDGTIIRINISKVFMEIRPDFSDLWLNKLKKELKAYHESPYSRNKEDEYPARKLYEKSKTMRGDLHKWMFEGKIVNLLKTEPEFVVLLGKTNMSLKFSSTLYQIMADEKIDFSEKPLSDMITEGWLFNLDDSFFNEHSIETLKKMNLLSLEKPVSIKLNGKLSNAQRSNGSLKLNLHENLALTKYKRNESLEKAGVIIRDSVINEIMHRLNLRAENSQEAISKIAIIQKFLIKSTIDTLPPKTPNSRL